MTPSKFFFYALYIKGKRKKTPLHSQSRKGANARPSSSEE
nr:MAG TPA: hypothetical protein [Caudoviricetes sp.]DAV78731.1 MAG TPA: hypothetical protein [Caudoviricetes sp.]